MNFTLSAGSLRRFLPLSELTPRNWIDGSLKNISRLKNFSNQFRRPNQEGTPVRDDYEPYAQLYVPENWENREEFIAELKPPIGFEHVSQYRDDELDATTSVFKYLRDESYVGPDGRFDASGFIEAFREATKTLVAMEKEVDQSLSGRAESHASWVNL